MTAVIIFYENIKFIIHLPSGTNQFYHLGRYFASLFAFAFRDFIIKWIPGISKQGTW